MINDAKNSSCADKNIEEQIIRQIYVKLLIKIKGAINMYEPSLPL